MSGVMKAPRVCRAPGSGWRTSTGMGFVSVAGAALGVSGLAGRAASVYGLSSSLPRSCKTSAARSNALLPAADPRKDCTFSRIVS